MKVVERVTLTMRSGYQIDITTDCIVGLKVLGINKENIVRINREFVKLRTADEISLIVSYQRNYDEYFENGQMKFFDRLKQKDIQNFTVVYKDGTYESFDLILSHIEVFEYTDSKDLRILIYIPEKTFENLRE